MTISVPIPGSAPLEFREVILSLYLNVHAKKHEWSGRRIVKNIISFVVIILFVVVSPAFAQIEETHEFGALNVQYFIYSDGKTFKFAAQNTMTVKTVEVKSWLATNIVATFHIELRIQDSLTDSLIAKWDQFVNRDATYKAYYHSKQLLYALTEGDSIVYKIYGNQFWSSEGGLRGINYVKLTGEKAVSVESDDTTPLEFLLSQNYPNPFNPVTLIRFSLPTRSNVMLTVYNALGQQVAELVNGEAQAGYHEVTFDATSLPSGVYFCRLHAGEYVTTKRMILMK